MIWFPIIPPHIHHDCDSSYLSEEFRKELEEGDLKIGIVGDVFSIIGLVGILFLVISLFYI